MNPDRKRRLALKAHREPGSVNPVHRQLGSLVRDPASNLQFRRMFMFIRGLVFLGRGVGHLQHFPAWLLPMKANELNATVARMNQKFHVNQEVKRLMLDGAEDRPTRSNRSVWDAMDSKTLATLR